MAHRMVTEVSGSRPGVDHTGSDLRVLVSLSDGEELLHQRDVLQGVNQPPFKMAASPRINRQAGN